MQYKKANVSKRIIDVGKEEFLENGYRGANIKTIAEKADVPVGNLYRYFDGKSGLLDAIVSPVYNDIPNILIKLARLFMSQSLTFTEVVPVLTENTLQLFDMYKSELLILAYRCEKTKYADFVDKIVGIICELVTSYMRNEPSDEQLEFLGLICKSFITTVFGLLRDGCPRERMSDITAKLIHYTFNDINERI